MKISATLFLLGLIAAPAARGKSATTPGTKEPFSLEISFSHEEIKTGVPIHIKIKFTNTSDHVMGHPVFYANGVATGYDYTVTDSLEAIERLRLATAMSG